MSDLENTTQESVNSGDLQQQVASLQRQITTLSIALVAVSFVFSAFVGLQAHRTAKDLEAIKPNAARLTQWATTDKPKIDAFVSQLVAYGQTHPEYAEKVLAKFSIKPGAPAPTGAVAPVAPTKK